MRKHPVSIALSKRILQKIDQEASKQKRSRSEYVELFFEDALFTPSNLDRQSGSPLSLSKKVCS
jgi:metal-responsive CopG/Arc/MetJ family transcriptional regulator